VAYLLSIVGLFTVMIFVGRRLEALQAEKGIAEASLGEVNPASAAFQLVLGGLKGPAVTILWWQAQDLERHGQYFKIEPCVRSMTLLAPHFQRPWEFQAWNLAFNIAANWESVGDKYYWIKRGVNYQMDAVRTNANQADLEWYVGYMYFNRIGTSDEKAFLRKMFREDPDLEFTQASSGLKDNFEKAFDWYTRANATCVRLNRRPKRMAPHPFMCQPSLSKTNYAETMGKEGTFGLPAIQAWERAYREWIRFGSMGGTDRDRDLIYKLEYTDSERAALTPEQLYWANRYDDMVKYRYWKERCRVEAAPEVQEAREAIHRADEARAEGRYNEAVAAYERGLPLWRELMIKNATFRDDISFREFCQQIEDDYLRLLAHVGKPTPARRPFDGVVLPLRESLYQDAAGASGSPAADEPAKAPRGEDAEGAAEPPADAP
jgi:hypothetical protein